MKIVSLWRHPIKGFTPEELKCVDLFAGAHFPNDRMFAIEDGPSGFDTEAPAHISKMKFIVLARSAKVARFETKYTDATHMFEIRDKIKEDSARFDMSRDQDLQALASWLAPKLSDDFNGPLKVIRAPGQHRFMDHDKAGFVSLINAGSVADIAEQLERPVSPQRFRGNIIFEGDAWCEDKWEAGQKLKIGNAELEVVCPTVRCKATHANPKTGEYDLDTVPILMQKFGRRTCGIYAKVVKSGSVKAADVLDLIEN